MRRSDHGDASVEAVLVVPVLLFLIMVVVQAGLWFHGKQVVTAAAQEGVQAGRLDGANAATGEEQARRFVQRISPSIARTATVHASRDAERTSVVVTGAVQPVLPGVSLTVVGRADAPTERFREDR